mgnify:CR=1 FL=1
MPKLCEFENCRKQASYSYFFQKPERCKEHREDRKKQYSICRCGKHQPNFGLLTDKRPSYCIKCKTDEMIDLKHKRCKENNCNIRPLFNFEGEKEGLYCDKHKKKNMICVASKKCKEIGCLSQPSFNFKGEKIRLYCSKHKKKNMVNINDKRCKEDGCNKIPSYNFEDETNGLYCKNHSKENMINVKSRRCKEIGCDKYPSFNFKGEKTHLYCKNHAKENMINISNKRCKNCADWPDSQIANKKYKNYCARCFQRLFPKDPLTFQIRSKTKEIAVRDYINTIFDGFQHDKSLFTGGCDCTHRRRIDHRKLIENTLLCIETDEKQHKYYDKKDEKDRYEDLYMVFSGKWIFIRFNPDKYTNKKGVRKNPTIARRLFKLKEEIEKQIKRIQNEENKELVEISYLYYDRFD